ncbi:DUF1788 domain-containing protein [Geobacillus sp. FSL W8-0466]|uniref:DUF1788 domain-containing protein n=1 Tax=Geobacillus sp. FSL W8-0466 TaxID=2975350 RepID=UPI0030D78083
MKSLILQHFDHFHLPKMASKLSNSGGTEALFDALRPTIEEEQLVDKIAEAAEQAQIIFITGIGSVFPLVRAHELLNQLHPKVTNVPIVIFYPGTYTGQGLSLFNRFESNGYYRAFSI